MRNLLLFAFGPLLVGMSGTEAVEKDLNLLKGDWVAVWAERDGMKVEFPKSQIFSIRGNKFCLGKRELILLKIDPTCTPKVIDLTFLDDQDASKGETVEGIYKIDGDTMIWCYYCGDGVKQRPLEFRAPKDSERLMFAYQRVKQ